MKKFFLIAPLLVAFSIILMACTDTGRWSESDTPNIDDAEHTAVIITPEETQTPTPEPCPITYEEIVMLAQTMHEEGQVVYWNGTKYGVSYIARQAGVGWCALNRLDDGGFGDTLAEVLSKPYQFAWRKDAPVTDHFLWLARDIVERWWAEKQGVTDVGRTLPSDYLFFEGDGRENHFRKGYEKTGEVWDWSIPDPYEEA